MKDKTRRNIFKILCIVICLSVIYLHIVNNEKYNNYDFAKKYILENHNKQTGAKNAVTAIYLNYRLWDTLFESMVLILSVIAVISFSWSHEHEE